MDSNVKTGRAVGLLFLVSYGGFIAGSALLASALDPSTGLATIYPNRTQVILGVLLEFLNDAAVIGIAVLLFPLLRRRGERLALWYVGFKVIEAATYVVGTISTLSLIKLSEEYMAAGAPSAPYYHDLRAMMLAGTYWAGQMATVSFVLAAVAFYWLLYRSGLIPRFISVWGLTAVALLVAANVLVPDPSQDFQPAMLLFLPMVANELFLAMWLVAKGFSSSAVDPPAYGSRTAIPEAGA